MNQIKVRVVSGYFEEKMCSNLITAMARVPGDSISAMVLFETLTSIYDEAGTTLRPAILQTMLRKTLCSPILLDHVLDFLLDIGSFEGIQVLSRKFPIPHPYFERLLSQLGSESEHGMGLPFAKT